MTFKPDDVDLKYKYVYKEFAIWFLKNKSIRLILLNPKWNSNLDKIESYLDYKNNRYMNFIKYPER